MNVNKFLNNDRFETAIVLATVYQIILHSINYTRTTNIRMFAMIVMCLVQDEKKESKFSIIEKH